ncbi:MAG: winged helix-turn-helix domain-containing protein [Solirubrobacteraceae bacterium]
MGARAAWSSPHASSRSSSCSPGRIGCSGARSACSGARSARTSTSRVWGYAMAHGDRSVDGFVRKLRQKLRTGSPRRSYIHTHFGLGYRFALEPDAVAGQLAAPTPPGGGVHEPEVVDDPARAQLLHLSLTTGNASGRVAVKHSRPCGRPGSRQPPIHNSLTPGDPRARRLCVTNEGEHVA